MVSLVRDHLYDVRDAISRDEFFHFHAAVRPYTECGNVRLRTADDCPSRLARRLGAVPVLRIADAPRWYLAPESAAAADLP